MKTEKGTLDSVVIPEQAQPESGTPSLTAKLSRGPRRKPRNSPVKRSPLVQSYL